MLKSKERINQNNSLETQMKKTKFILALLVIGLIGGSIWLLRAADPKHIERQEVVTDIADTFNK